MRSAAAVFLVLFLASLAAAADVTDDWFAIHIGEAKSGWVHTRTEGPKRIGATGAVTYVTDMTSRIEFARGPDKVTVMSKDRIVENADGVVIRFIRVQNLGGGTVTTSGALLPRKAGAPLQLAVVTAGRESTIPYPTNAIGPVAMSRRIEKTGLKEGAKFTAVDFSLDFLGRVIQTEVVIGKKEEIEILGAKKTLTRVTKRTSIMPTAPGTEWIDDDGRLHLLEQPMRGMGVMRLSRTVEKIAKLPGEPAEMFLSTLIPSDRVIPKPRAGGRAVYRLRGDAGGLAKIPSGVGQFIEEVDDGSLLVTVDTARMAAKASFTLPYDREKADGLLDPTAMLESDDPTVMKFAREAVGDTTDPVAAGRAIEAYVRKKIKSKSLSVALASAAETAKSLEGDCTEHSVLGAAMARAVGLPSRVVIGVVYLPPGGGMGGKTGIFGYHMWFEVMVGEDAWLPLDAAVGTMDRTHIAFARSDMKDVNPLVDLMLPLIELMGSLKIEVVETE